MYKLYTIFVIMCVFTCIFQNGMKRLVHQMSQLHKEYVSLQEKNELLLQDVAQLTSDKERLQDELLSAKSIVPLRVCVCVCVCVCVRGVCLCVILCVCMWAGCILK